MPDLLEGLLISRESTVPPLFLVLTLGTSWAVSTAADWGCTDPETSIRGGSAGTRELRCIAQTLTKHAAEVAMVVN
jgi:hypothetical protein